MTYGIIYYIINMVYGRHDLGVYEIRLMGTCVCVCERESVCNIQVLGHHPVVAYEIRHGTCGHIRMRKICAVAGPYTYAMYTCAYSRICEPPLHLFPPNFFLLSKTIVI